jgi:hypothetical protein
VRLGVLLTAALFICLPGIEAAGGGTSDSGTPADAVKVARTYVQAYNRRDGKTMCSQFSSELRDWFVHLPGLRGSPSCAKMAAGRIGYGEESDTPIFQRLTILSATPTVTGEQARVTIRARYRFKKYPKPFSHVVTDQIYLANRSGSWRVVKPGGVWFFTQSAYNIPENTLDPPISDAEAHQPAPQLPASFECEAAPGNVINDAVGDAPASLDVRRATATFNNDGSVCVRIAFQSPPYPGTTVDLGFEQRKSNDPRISLTEASIRVGSGGQLHLTYKRHEKQDASRWFQAGWVDGELRVLWFAQKGSVRSPFTLRYGGATRTFQFWEPLINDPMHGRGEPWEGRGDAFGRSFG